MLIPVVLRGTHASFRDWDLSKSYTTQLIIHSASLWLLLDVQDARKSAFAPWQLYDWLRVIQ
jgi:hypothetical protein